MLAAVIWLALLEIWTATRLFLDVDLVGMSTLTHDLIESTHRGKADVHVLTQCTASSWVVD
ncbi:hypothetical protein C488_15332 [Natrinema pellirubrum DSM 15624]|uniref:Uncharacterized protein n=1 Tax=Natrinema pellirubrum (strain DSM 15624 / CIP 106293 / JCM 10476 / NCIMB 786 / 157) TaxID=797303 RepID=L9YDJ7_NATP1|nr:hypothetical protein C488_15332 [Natrinema pellirubrum DSM 15624]